MLSHKSSFPPLVEFCRKVRIMNKKIAFAGMNFNFARGRSRAANLNAIIASHDVFPIQSFYGTSFVKLISEDLAGDFFPAT